MPNNKKGFTLIELLVVMGILGILMAVTILVINPAEYLARSRDTQRINDLSAVSSALGIYQANEGALSTVTGCALDRGSGTTVSTIGALSCNSSALTIVVASANRTSNTGTGWIPTINFSTMTGGAPFAALPIDPSSTGRYFYMYSSDGSTFELSAHRLESVYYKTTSDIDSKDGGKDVYAYEVGTNLNLILADGAAW
jgi:prepilin-type N-terminal cleavage/methylation domain-containing protein